MGRAGVGGRGGTPLSPSERRDAYGKDTASGPLAGFKGLRPTAGQGPKQIRQWLWWLLWWLLLLWWWLLLWWLLCCGCCGGGCSWLRWWWRVLVALWWLWLLWLAHCFETILATRVFCDTSGPQCSAVVSKPR